MTRLTGATPVLLTGDNSAAARLVGEVDAVVVRDDLATVPAVIKLPRRARRVVIANLVIAAAFITGLVIWDLAGTLPLPRASPDTKAQPSSSASTDCACCATQPGTAPPAKDAPRDRRPALVRRHDRRFGRTNCG